MDVEEKVTCPICGGWMEPCSLASCGAPSWYECNSCGFACSDDYVQKTYHGLVNFDDPANWPGESGGVL